MNCYFVTGTDTDAGKTVAAVALLQALQAANYYCLAMKPVAAGAADDGAGLRNDDALQLLANLHPRQADNWLPSYTDVNPICFAEPVAPHLAAARHEQSIRISELLQHTAKLTRQQPDCLLIEGAGGWLLPLNDSETMADFVQELGASVILVVGLKLGCLNHALLTVADIERRGLRLAGWIANQPLALPMTLQQENLSYLKQRIPAPCLGVLPFIENFEQQQPGDYLTGIKKIFGSNG
ncbi:dethiobiotin synthase [Pseudidiomarina sp.]|uniref:dethiobiotin synthase n=1 Tax=Pseudidiomarina sp. TaxID=2081707 RepID=UPI00299F076A|nr:dethiobiotin synthase [Pseudidiomarina sp.]MDX1704968.1 dethiobiotin synthase [Pseudidiomarina sp.]